MLYYIVLLFSKIMCRMPGRLCWVVGKAIGLVGWIVVPNWRKQLAVKNFAEGMDIDEDAAHRIVKTSVVRFGAMFVQVLRFPMLNASNLEKQVRIEGEHHLKAALELGKGVVLATAHSGNWELLGSSLALRGFPLVAVVKKQRNMAMDRFINTYRRKMGMHVTYKTGVRDMVRLLGQGKIIGLLMDQDANNKGVFVRFFNRWASTPAGAAALARLNDSPIVPAFITEGDDGIHSVVFHPPLQIDKTANKDVDILIMTQQLTGIVEQHIRLHAEEWFWLHNRWKTVPTEQDIRDYYCAHPSLKD